MSIKILGDKLPNIPWEDKPAGCEDAMWRFSGNPIMGRHKTARSSRIYNSGCMPYGDRFVGIFRSDHKDGNHYIHLGWSDDAINWDIDDSVINWVDEDGQPYQPAYAYDPRLLKIEDDYYIIFCTDFGNGPTIGLGKTRDFKTFVRMPNPFLICNRNGVLFPRKIGGYYQMMSRPSDFGHTPFGDIYLSKSKDMRMWGYHTKMMSKGGSPMQNLKIGAGTVPIETDKGWLMFYHGVQLTCNGYIYSIAAALLDIDNPGIVLRRSKDYLITPEMDYETVGMVANVCFPCGSLADAETGRIAVYYGAADTHIAVAFTTAGEVYDWLMREDNYACCYGDDIVIR